MENPAPPADRRGPRDELWRMAHGAWRAGSSPPLLCTITESRDATTWAERAARPAADERGNDVCG